MSSLRGQLSAGLLASLLVVFGIQVVLVSLAIRDITENYVASRLSHEIEDLLAALRFDQEGKLRLDTKRIAPVFKRPFSGHYYWIVAPPEQVLSRSLWDTDPSVPELSTGERRRFYLEGPSNQPLLVVAQNFRKQDRSVTLAVAEDVTSIREDILRFQVRYGILTFVLLVILIAAQRLLVRRSVRPLERARGNLAQLEQGQVRRLDEGVPDEIRPLVREINHLIEITLRRLRRSRNAVGDLAHSLKTPLTVLTQISEDSSLELDSTVREPLQAQVAEMRRLIGRQLTRARLAGEGPVSSRFEVAAEIEALCGALRRTYAEREIRIDAQLPAEKSFPADREDMLELLGNLLDNACKWARRYVRISATCDRNLAITIEDDGPGVSDDRLSDLTHRGHRLDEEKEGHGLGLSIAQDIVNQYGGAIRFDRSPELGGLRVRIQLPSTSEGIET